MRSRWSCAVNSVENVLPTFCVGESGVTSSGCAPRAPAARATARRTARRRRSARRARSSGTGGRRSPWPAGRAAHGPRTSAHAVRLTRRTDDQPGERAAWDQALCRRPRRGRRLRAVLGRVDEGLAELAAQGQRTPGPGRVGAGQPAGRRGHGQRGQPRAVEAEPVGQVEPRAGRAAGRCTGPAGPGPACAAPGSPGVGGAAPGVTAGDQPEQQRDAGVPHLPQRVQRAGCAVAPATSGRVASMPSAAAPTPASSRTGGRAAQQCSTTGTSRPAIRSRSSSWASWADTDRTVPQPDAVGLGRVPCRPGRPGPAARPRRRPRGAGGGALLRAEIAGAPPRRGGGWRGSGSTPRCRCSAVRLRPRGAGRAGPRGTRGSRCWGWCRRWDRPAPDSSSAAGGASRRGDPAGPMPTTPALGRSRRAIRPRALARRAFDLADRLGSTDAASAAVRAVLAGATPTWARHAAMLSRELGRAFVKRASGEPMIASSGTSTVDRVRVGTRKRRSSATPHFSPLRLSVPLVSTPA